MSSQEFIWSIKNGDVASAEKFLKESKLKIDNEMFCDETGRHAIIIAADYGHADIIKLLLKYKANINVQDKFGITALLAAIFEGHTACVKLLLENGADKNLKTPDGSSYVDAAEKNEIKTLLQG